MAPCRSLGINERVAHRYLEDPTPGGDQSNVVDDLLELLEDSLRQTDGSRRIASLGAVLD